MRYSNEEGFQQAINGKRILVMSRPSPQVCLRSMLLTGACAHTRSQGKKPGELELLRYEKGYDIFSGRFSRVLHD